MRKDPLKIFEEYTSSATEQCIYVVSKDKNVYMRFFFVCVL